MKDIFSAHNLRQTAISALGAGLTYGLTSKIADMTKVNMDLRPKFVGPNLPLQIPSFAQHLQVAAVRTAASFPVQAALSDNVLDALSSALTQGVASAVGSYGSSRIGGAFHAGRLDDFSRHVLHAGVGAGTALITGGDPLSGGVGAVIGEAVASAYRNGTFGNTPLDQNSPDYAERVEYGVKVAKIVTALCVGYAGGDIESAVTASENAARHNSFGIHNMMELRFLQIQRDSAQTTEERAYIDALIENSVLKTQERVAQAVVDEFMKDLPEGALKYIRPVNECIQREIDQRERVFQSYDEISPLYGAAMRFQGLDTTLALHAATLPTSQGGAFLSVMPGLNYVGAAGKVALNTAKPLLRSAVSLIRKELAGLKAGLGSHASRLGQTTNNLSKTTDKIGTSVFANSSEHPASSVKQAQLLRNSLISEELGAGHAFEKHIVKQGEFPGWIRTRSQFTQHIEQVLNDPLTHSKVLSNNKTAYWHSPTSTVVIRNPNAIDGGTVFQPLNGINYFRELR